MEWSPQVISEVLDILKSKGVIGFELEGFKVTFQTALPSYNYEQDDDQTDEYEVN